MAIKNMSGFKHLRMLDYAIKNKIRLPRFANRSIIKESAVDYANEVAKLSVCIDVSEVNTDNVDKFMPCIIPPFPSYWIEDSRVIDGRIEGNASLWTNIDLDPNISITDNLKNNSGLFWKDVDIPGIQKSIEKTGISVDSKGLRWGIRILGFSSVMDVVFGPLYQVIVLIDELGLPLGENVKEGRKSLYWPFSFIKGKDESFLDGIIGECFYVHTLMSCKNVIFEDVQAPRNVRRSVKRLYDYDTVTYKRLAIDPNSTPGQKSAPKGLWENRHHLVRGHMRDFRRKGLFGKYFGMFYCPSHMRGNKEKGEVVKDYSVKDIE